ncbi:hypothetical protein JVT61DRAFT_13082 [Boletus reticuloceps]|uniref:Uncharacterized protein n=1 Tax=Boletus reticuloceps TaxID=495285 RepID=A0A8I2YUK0_9AGAM|nr:hypothetical protein JVT61DRAFT_13082 [Boletus reticuloceps]
MDCRQGKHQFVQQYVERQKAYLPTYTTEHPWNERHVNGTPSKPLRGGDFGFDTPVLRPRVPVKKTSQSKLTQRMGQSKSRTHATESGPPQSLSPPPAPGKVTETQSPALSKRDKPRPKRKKASTPSDADNERAARLADRRERKRKKRAIVNPPQQEDDATPAAAPQKGRTSSQKAKKPAALALLYGFSATNVTKDRLTLKPVPSLGVFSKGRASAKKQVTATRKPSSREVFSESAFLNKPSEQAADHSKVDDDPDDSSVSSIPNDRKARATRITRPTRMDRGNRTETTALKVPQASTRATVESEVWDIELQSKLPSSARGVSSEPEASESVPVVLDLRGADWTVSLDIADKQWECSKTRTRSLSRARSFDRSPPLAIISDLDVLGHPHAADAPSIHPSHSASQVGRRVSDTQPSDARQVTSKYFIEPEAVLEQEFAANCAQSMRSNEGLDVLDSQTIPSVASPINIAQPMVEFQTRYDMAPLEFPSDCSPPYDDCYAQVPLEPLGGYFECSTVGTQGDQEHRHACQRSRCAASDDVIFDGAMDPLAPEHEGDLEEPWGGTLQDFAIYEEEGVDESMCWDGQSVGEDVAEFLEGRALLLGVPEWPGRRVGLSGLAQAEMDVANRLRDHWRPQRLS